MPMNCPCPNCGENLDVPPEFTGKLVRCPTCRIAFVVEEEPILIKPMEPEAEEEEPIEIRVVQTDPVDEEKDRSSSRHDRRRPRKHRDRHEGDDDDYGYRDDREDGVDEELAIRWEDPPGLKQLLNHTSVLLTMSACFTLVLGFANICSLCTIQGGNSAHTLGILVGGLVLIVCGALVIVGSSALNGVWSHGLAITAVILSCCLALLGLLGIISSGLTIMGGGFEALIGIVLLIVCFLQFLSSLIAGVYGCTVVFRADVAAFFRARSIQRSRRHY